MNFLVQNENNKTKQKSLDLTNKLTLNKTFYSKN